MVRAVKVGTVGKKQYEKAIEDYEKLHNMFHVQPKLGEYI